MIKLVRNTTTKAPINKFGKVGYIECVETALITHKSSAVEDLNYRLRHPFTDDEIAYDLYTKSKEWAFHGAYIKHGVMVSIYIPKSKVIEVIKR